MGSPFRPARRQAIVEKVHKALEQELAREDVQKKLEGAGANVSLSTPAEFSKVIERDIASFRTAASKAGIVPK